jgi:acyl-CoA thioester hydrolase
VTATLGAIERRVEHVDTDASGVMHFARHPSLIETAALESLDRLGIGLNALVEEGLDLVITQVRMTYRRPARFLDLLTITVGVAHVGAASFRIDGEVALDANSVSAGTLVFGSVTKAVGSPSVLPTRFTQVLKGFA